MTRRRSAAYCRAVIAIACEPSWFLREVVPKLSAYSLSAIAAATGLSLAACSRVTAGATVPHPRHWEVLIALSKRKGD